MVDVQLLLALILLGQTAFRRQRHSCITSRWSLNDIDIFRGHGPGNPHSCQPQPLHVPAHNHTQRVRSSSFEVLHAFINFVKHHCSAPRNEYNHYYVRQQARMLPDVQVRNYVGCPAASPELTVLYATSRWSRVENGCFVTSFVIITSRTATGHTHQVTVNLDGGIARSQCKRLQRVLGSGQPQLQVPQRDR